MKILSIETSCDETAVAILDIQGPLEKPEIKILGNTLLSQIALHEQYGGVFPMLAKREHEKNLPVLLEQTLKQAELDGETPDIDFIAVTAGPGLEPALWAGITFAEKLREKWGKSVIPINHMEGHIWSVLFEAGEPVQLPALSLLVSGGHTEIVLVKGFGEYEILGRTLDDAVGEAYDKVARMLGLPYPGGPKISALAEASRMEKRETNFKFPRPMINSGNLNFSYSGLKTAVLYKLQSQDSVDDELKKEVARAFEDAAIEVLVEKTRQALDTVPYEIKTLIVGGGVAGNKHLQSSLNTLISNYPELKLLFPTKALTTDNAVMIGLAAFVETTVHPEILSNINSIKARGNLSLS